MQEAEQVAQQTIQGLKFSTLQRIAGARTWIWDGWEWRGQPSAACSSCVLQGCVCHPAGPALEGNSESGCWNRLAGTGLADGDGRVGSGDPRKVRAGKSKRRGRLRSPRHPCYGAGLHQGESSGCAGRVSLRAGGRRNEVASEMGRWALRERRTMRWKHGEGDEEPGGRYMGRFWAKSQLTALLLHAEREVHPLNSRRSSQSPVLLVFSS